jgi:hypothetical protein
MAFQLSNKEACRLARELATLLGVTPEEAVLIAAKERWERLSSVPDSKALPPQPPSAIKQPVRS